MRQVPDYYIVGNGRMAKHFCHYLALLNIPYAQWDRQQTTPFSAFIQKTDTLYLLISDTGLHQLLQAPELQSHRLIHFSATVQHPNGISVHPLMTFGLQLYDLERYQSMPFVLDQPDLHLGKLLPGLPNRAYYLPPTLKVFYHCMLVLGGNLSMLLWQKMMRELTQLHIAADDLNAYLAQTLTNFIHDPVHNLTGPLVRGDEATIQKHLHTLKEDDFLPIYRAFTQAFLTEKE